MKKPLQKILLRLFFLTPFGYILDLIDLVSGEKIPGIKAELGAYSPFRANVKTNPTAKERLNWFVSGLFLLAQSYFIFRKENDSITGGYGIAALIFGLVALISSIFPQVQWNRPLFRK